MTRIKSIEVCLAIVGDNNLMMTMSGHILSEITHHFQNTSAVSVVSMGQHEIDALPAAMRGVPYHVSVKGWGDTVSVHTIVCQIVEAVTARAWYDVDTIEVRGHVKNTTAAIPATTEHRRKSED